MTGMTVAAIILAAGASRRLGQAKQLVVLHGETMLHRTARLAIEAGCTPVRVVLGAETEACLATLQDLDVQIILNPEWREGMGSSVRAGIASLPLEVDGALLLVCDQPALDSALIVQLLTTHNTAPDRVVASLYSQIRGIPALFPKHLFPTLSELHGDKGARSMLREGEVLEIPFPEGELDLDRPEDLERLKNSENGIF